MTHYTSAGPIKGEGTPTSVPALLTLQTESPMKNFDMQPDSDIERAVIYVRVSTDRQVDGASLEVQERDCRTMCERNGWQVLRVFREEGESAKTADRPQLQELLTYCRVNRPRPNYVVVHNVDRWARKGTDHDAMKLYLAKFNVKLRSYMQRLGDDPHDEFFERILSGLAELDNRQRSMRSLAGMKARLQNGGWPFKAPLGYRNVRSGKTKSVALDPDRAPLIRQAFELYATGLHSREDVRKRVNALGLRTLRGNNVGRETFSRMLRNPRYMGVLHVEKWDLQVEGEYPAIVSADVFQRVQDQLQQKAIAVTPKQRNNPDFPLRHFVRCGRCLRPLTASWSKGKKGVKYAYYRCQNRACPSPVNAARQQVEMAFVDFLKQQQPNPAYLKLFHKVILDVWKQKQGDALDLIDQLEKRVRELKDRKRKLNEAFVFNDTNRVLTQADYVQMRDDLNEQLAVVELERDRARMEEIDVDRVIEFSENLLLDTSTAWQRCSLEQKQRLQQVLFPEGVEFAEGAYRTQASSFLFNDMMEPREGSEMFGSATGNRTRV